MTTLINQNPIIYEASANNSTREWREDEDLEDSVDPIDAQEIFDLIRSISDPEHPLSLEQLNVTQRDHIQVSDENNSILVEFTPTIPHCSMATLIGLCIRVRLLRCLPARFKDQLHHRHHIGAMAANFWTSSHANDWILDRRRLDEAMREDLEYVDIATLTKIKMWYYNIIGKIGKRLQFRQQVVATAIVYFKRFYT
ncbi:Mitotic spindle-associated MMXD complex subunit MIP18, partial [Haplosporangium bisporale]